MIFSSSGRFSGIVSGKPVVCLQAFSDVTNFLLVGKDAVVNKRYQKRKSFSSLFFAFAVSHEYGGTIKIKRTGKDGLDLNKRGTPTLRTGTKQTGSSGTIYALPTLTH